MSFTKKYKKFNKTVFPPVQIDTVSYHTLSEQIESLLKPGIETILANQTTELEYDSELGSETPLNEIQMDPTNNIAFDKLDAIETAEKLETKLSDSVSAVSNAQKVSEVRASENANSATETASAVS